MIQQMTLKVETLVLKVKEVRVELAVAAARMDKPAPPSKAVLVDQAAEAAVVVVITVVEAALSSLQQRVVVVAAGPHM
jgi:hypothetical protein